MNLKSKTEKYGVVLNVDSEMLGQIASMLYGGNLKEALLGELCWLQESGIYVDSLLNLEEKVIN